MFKFHQPHTLSMWDTQKAVFEAYMPPDACMYARSVSVLLDVRPRRNNRAEIDKSVLDGAV